MRDDGDEREATEFISLNRGRMRRIAVQRLRHLGHPDPLSYADDVVAMASHKIVLNWADWHSPMGALVRVTKNEAATLVRKHRSRRETDLESIEAAGIRNSEPGGSPEQILERAELLSVAMSGLNEKEQELLVLRYYGMEFEEIATADEIPVGTLTSMYARALKKMRKALEAAQASSPNDPDSDPEDSRMRRGGLRNPITTEG
jgi:RNA polymerase sigma factor (sigma-70 family)